MAKNTYRAANPQRSRLQVEALLKGLGEAADAAVLVVPSYRHAVGYQKYLARGPFLFGLTVTTLASWVEGRWALLGDGRAIVSPLQRELLLYRVMAELVGQGEVTRLGLTPGTVRLLASMAHEAFTPLSDQRLVNAVRPLLTEAEEEVCLVFQHYAHALQGGRLCEPAQAMDLVLASSKGFPPFIFEGFDRFTYTEEHFIERLARKASVQVIEDTANLSVKAEGRSKELVDLQQCIFDPDPADPVEPTGAVGFLFPAGRYAAARLVGQAIAERVEAARVEAARAGGRGTPAGQDAPHFIVSAYDPAALFRGLAAYLLPRGIAVRASAQKPFSTTAFGKAFLALLRFVHEPRYTTFLMSDFVLSPFSGLSLHRGYSFDAAWRRDRTADKRRCLDDLSKASDQAGQLVAALAGGNLAAAFDVFEFTLRQESFADDAYRSEQLAALALARRFFEAAEAVSLAFGDAVLLLADRPVSCGMQVVPPLSGASGGDGAPGGSHAASVGDGVPGGAAAAVVDIMSLDEASLQEACSCDTLVICDLETFSYPVRDAADAKTLLFEKLGIDTTDDALARMRRRFFRVLGTPIRRLVCERVLNTVDAEAAYPAVMFEELVDCYRNDLASLEGIDKRTGLPEVLLPHAQSLGEDRLYENLAVDDDVQAQGADEELPVQGSISAAARGFITLPLSAADAGTGAGADASAGVGADAGADVGAGMDVGAGVGALLRLSPSAIESYLECPYKWFAQRRLRVKGLDAGFGALEKGSFAHAVLKAFYQDFQSQGFTRVEGENIKAAQATLTLAFDTCLEAQSGLEPRDNPLVPLSELEKAEVVSLKRQLLAHLEREAAFLPGFAPRFFEEAFGADPVFCYAGSRLTGSIDRIDVNGKGQAVVVDYKGSLVSDYALSSAGGPASGLEPAPTPGPASAGEVPCVALPYKVQALIYAQAVQKLLGLEVVGALYVSYGRGGVAGAIDSRVLDPAELPGIDARACSVQEAGAPSFAALLDAVEDLCVPAVERLAVGDIAPAPRGSDPCGYCPVRACVSRVGP
ncbi:MAG: PD-(D/E)XK nuclease family protein [Eggerthellaceae bacterium]|nr:PD-(D/E)XK nuclease family protein [Eggerthellaceae bacterium]